jgi:hypothetical protein
MDIESIAKALLLCDGNPPQEGDNVYDIIHKHWHNPGPKCNPTCRRFCQGCRVEYLDDEENDG